MCSKCGCEGQVNTEQLQKSTKQIVTPYGELVGIKTVLEKPKSKMTTNTKNLVLLGMAIGLVLVVGSGSALGQIAVPAYACSEMDSSHSHSGHSHSHSDSLTPASTGTSFLALLGGW